MEPGTTAACAGNALSRGKRFGNIPFQYNLEVSRDVISDATQIFHVRQAESEEKGGVPAETRPNVKN